MKNQSYSRRQFLATAAAVAAFQAVPRAVVGGPGQRAPSAKLNIAGIGVGGMGASNLRQLETENIVALCDVDHTYAAKTFERYPQAKVYVDYRRMLETQRDIDAVVIGTPDHTHAVIALEAMRAGKHVYCQKPLTHNVAEARRLAEVARECKVATQMGIQGHSGEGIRLICEWIGEGALGEVTEVDAWCSLSYFPFGHASWSSPWSTRPTDTPAVPKDLDWDLWIGPAPMRPYHPAYHPMVWRCWRDFGSGMMGDRGAHTLDPVYWALKLGAPTSVEAASMGSTDEIYQLSAIVTYRFPARDTLPPVKLTWYEGLRPPRPEDLEDGRQMGHQEGGALFKGTKGKLVCGVYGDSPRLLPESRMKEYGRPGRQLPRVEGSHEMDWVRACKAGEQPGAHFGYAGPLTEICALGNLAIRMDARLEWDSARLRVTNLEEANRWVGREYRPGWSLG